MTPDELGQLFPVELADYNPEWPAVFEKEKNRILSGSWENEKISLEHIGSTAIPGMIAKPCIDMIALIDRNTGIPGLREHLAELGYHSIPKPENPPPHLMFVKGYTLQGFQGQAFHIHVRYERDPDEIIFRDFLVDHHDLAEEYKKLKIKLAGIHKFNREHYTEAKNDFVKRINCMARAEQ